MILVEIPSKTYKLNEDILMKKTKLKEPITIIEESPINVNDSLNGYPLTITSLYGNTSQDGTPTSTEPIPIKVVTGDVTVEVTNENLIDLTKYSSTTNPKFSTSSCQFQNRTANSISLFPVGTYSNVYLIYENRLKKNADITMTGIFKEVMTSRTSNIGIFIAGSYDGTNYTTISSVPNTVSTNESKKLTATANVGEYNYIRIRIYANNSNTGGSGLSQVDVSELMLAYGTEDIFVANQSQTKLLSLGDKELAKIGDYQDKLFKAEDGNKVYDSLTSEQKATLTYGNCYKYKAVDKFTDMSQLTNNGVSSTTVSLLTPALNIKASLTSSNTFAISNTLTPTIINGTGMNGTNTSKKIRVNVSTSLAEDHSQAKTVLTNAGTVIYYGMEEPIFEEITDTTLISQLDALYDLVTYKNITNIFTTTDNEEPELEINYYNSSCVDIVSEIVDSIDGYIDNKEAMKQAIYHILRTERYDYLIYSNNYGVELRQYIGESFEYLRNTIEQTLRDALTYDLRIKDVVVNKVEQKDSDKAVVNFTAYTIYGDLQMEVSVVV